MIHYHVPPMKELMKRYAWVRNMNRIHHCPECFYPKKGKKHSFKLDKKEKKWD